MNEVLSRIKSLRVGKNLKQSDFAKMVNMTQGGYSKIELGITELSINTLSKIASALNVSVQYLLFGDGQGSQDTTEKDRRIRELEQEKRLLEWELGLREKEYKTTMYWIERLNELRESILPKLEQRESFVINSLLEYVKAVKENTNFTDNNA
jgi:transcriptional regulator with XRE-family HTH domain